MDGRDPDAGRADRSAGRSEESPGRTVVSGGYGRLYKFVFLVLVIISRCDLLRINFKSCEICEVAIVPKKEFRNERPPSPAAVDDNSTGAAAPLVAPGWGAYMDRGYTVVGEA